MPISAASWIYTAELVVPCDGSIRARSAIKKYAALTLELRGRRRDHEHLHARLRARTVVRCGRDAGANCKQHDESIDAAPHARMRVADDNTAKQEQQCKLHIACHARGVTRYALSVTAHRGFEYARIVSTPALRTTLLIAVSALAACAPKGPRGDTPDAAGGLDAGGGGIDGADAGTNCSPSPPLATGAMIDPMYATHYALYNLGAVPGVPSPLGGSTISSTDDNTLLIAGASENSGGAIYSIKVLRNACGHIYAFDGSAQLVATTPYVDASLVYAPNNVLFYVQWPGQYMFSELAPGSTTADRSIDERTSGMMGGGLGSIGFVPPGLAGSGGLRGLIQSEGYWYDIDLAADGNLYSITSSTMTTTLPHWPGGFAYVPNGSPDFPNPSLVVAEWDNTTVAAYDVDAQGDPMVSTRRPFIDNFDKPWGAYFEPRTGDYFFLSWGAGAQDQVFVVQGFVPPVIF